MAQQAHSIQQPLASEFFICSRFLHYRFGLSWLSIGGLWLSASVRRR
jgi:hypothetical protein